jgi:predicted permease
MIELTPGTLKSFVWVLAIASAVQLLCYLAAKLLFPRTERSERACIQYGLICSNATFIGLPIINSIYGAEGVVLASIAILPLRVMMWTAGVSLFQSGNKSDRRKVIIDLLKNPCILAVLAGVVLIFAQIKLPEFLYDGINSLSVCTSGLAMLLIGSMLAEVDFRTVIDRLTLSFSLVRLVVLPVVIIVTLGLLHADPLIIGVVGLCAAMPAGSTTAMLAEQYSANSAFASKIIFVSTVLSLLTIPFMVTLVELF